MHLKQPHRLVAPLCLGHPVNASQEPSPVQLTMTPRASLSFVERRHAFTSATVSGYFLLIIPRAEDGLPFKLVRR